MSDLIAVPTGPRWVDAGSRLHNLEPEIVHARLKEDLAQYAGRDWYACVMFSHGKGALLGASAWGYPPLEDRCDLMYRLAVRLNREMHHGGHWVTAWVRQHDALLVLWRDADGDLQFELGIDNTWERVRDWTIDDHMSLAEKAWQHWHEVWSRGLALKPEQTIKRAQGQQRSLVSH